MEELNGEVAEVDVEGEAGAEGTRAAARGAWFGIGTWIPKMIAGTGSRIGV